jgi:hypothetical protein
MAFGITSLALLLVELLSSLRAAGASPPAALEMSGLEER